MISKLVRYNRNGKALLERRVAKEWLQTRVSHLIPPSQYDTPFPSKFKVGPLLRDHWETLPLFFVTGVAMSFVVIATIWAIRNKTDVVYSTHSRAYIARTMDLRHPTCHKMVIINQVYDPWPEMQDVLDKMKLAEKRALARATAC